MPEKCIEYFASRNGFDGFTSYFNNVFAPERYTKVFILKGGPGTGKSTLMKKLHSAFNDFCDSIECIRCSSDINSYDGLILEKNDRKIAVLDGTAPHMTDPTLPVVCEETINLEVAIRERDLLLYRNTLEELYKAKKNEYQLAYHFLLVCGELSRNYSAVSPAIDNDEEKSNLFYLLDRIPYSMQGESNIRLYTSFGKDGFCQLTNTSSNTDETLIFNRKSREAEFLLSQIKKYGLGTNYIVNCFDGEIDALEIPTLGISVLFSEKRTVEASLLSIYSEAMEISKKHFITASNHHFEMERIYSEALNFSILNDIFSSLEEKAKVLLSIS